MQTLTPKKSYLSIRDFLIEISALSVSDSGFVLGKVGSCGLEMMGKLSFEGGDGGHQRQIRTVYCIGGMRAGNTQTGMADGAKFTNSSFK